MGAKQLERKDIGRSIVWLLKTDNEYVIRLRQKPDSGLTGDMAFIMPLGAEWFCNMEVVARAAFHWVVSSSRLTCTILHEFHETPEHEMSRLKLECATADAALKKAIAETGDIIRLPHHEDCPED